MDKISRIIPSNSRTRAIDVTSSQPVRPGAPTWGRREGRVTKAPLEIEDRVSLSDAMSTADRAIAAQPTTYKNRVQEAKTRAADEVSRRFFEGNAKSEAREVDLPKSEEALKNLNEVRLERQRPESLSAELGPIPSFKESAEA